eukprot:s993_g9.t1
MLITSTSFGRGGYAHCLPAFQGIYFVPGSIAERSDALLPSGPVGQAHSTASRARDMAVGPSGTHSCRGARSPLHMHSLLSSRSAVPAQAWPTAARAGGQEGGEEGRRRKEKREMPTLTPVLRVEDVIASATQCYTQSPRRGKPSPPPKNVTANLPAVPSAMPRAVPADADAVPSSGTGPHPPHPHPGTILLAPSRNGICRSSFQVQKALQRWQRDALAAHRLLWDRQTQGSGLASPTSTSRELEEPGEKPSGAPTTGGPVNEEGVPPGLVRILDSDDVSAERGLVAPAPSEPQRGKLSPRASPRGSMPARRHEDPRTPRGKASPKAKPQRLRHLLKRRQEKRGERLEAAKKVTQAKKPWAI